MKIETKFVIGNKQGVDTLSFIAAATAREKFMGKISDPELEDFIHTNFNWNILLTELNSLSNQYLVVYVDDEPAGYGKVTSKGTRPQAFDGKTVARIADFSILRAFDDPAISNSLFERCLSLTVRQQLVWIDEYEFDPFIPFFESYGFKRNIDVAVSKELPLPVVCLVKEN